MEQWQNRIGQNQNQSSTIDLRSCCIGITKVFLKYKLMTIELNDFVLTRVLTDEWSATLELDGVVA